jgi:hypothetical protein
MGKKFGKPRKLPPPRLAAYLLIYFFSICGLRRRSKAGSRLLKRKAIITGSPYWWSRYEDCLGYY